jgi:hypothetical protein
MYLPMMKNSRNIQKTVDFVFWPIATQHLRDERLKEHNILGADMLILKTL